MLVQNPIVNTIYEHGYDGMDEMFQYWSDHHDNLIDLINKNPFNNFNLPMDLIELEHKIRWASIFGIWFRLYIKISLRKMGEDFRFEDIITSFGKSEYSFDDIIRNVSEFVEDTDYIDLRGISLLKLRMENLVISHTDFSYCSFDWSMFKNVTFIDCCFDRTSFYRTDFINCSFDEDCVFKNNDFSKAIVDSEFHSEIKSPVIIPATFKTKVKYLVLGNPKFLDYTVVQGSSFYECSKDVIQLVGNGTKSLD